MIDVFPFCSMLGLNSSLVALGMQPQAVAEYLKKDTTQVEKLLLDDNNFADEGSKATMRDLADCGRT